MRVSDSHIYDLNYASMDAARTRYEQKAREATTQRRVFTPSDDPVAAAAAYQEQSKLERMEGHERAVSAGLAALQLADSALASYGELLIRVRELAIQQANETQSAETRAAAATEIEKIRDALLEGANTELGGRFIFAGYQSDVAPYDAAGNYAGDAGVRSFEVAPGVRLAAGVPGDEVFGAAAGGIDIHQAVQDLQNALLSDDVGGIRAAIDAMDLAQAQVSNARGDLGGQMASFETAGAVLERASLLATERREKAVGVDTAESYLDLTRAQQSLDTAVQIAAQLPLRGLAGR